MSINKRREEIAGMLLKKDKVTVRELADIFDVSTETIRKDLLALQNKGLIKKNKGSAEILIESNASAYAKKSEKAVDLKKEIAQTAAQLIPENSVIFMDAGSTSYQLARQLIMRKDLIVITNFSPVAELMNANEIKVIQIGGEVRAVSGAATGMLAIYCINKVHADIAFLGASGISDLRGPCVENFPEAEVKEAMINNAEKVYVMADSTKMGHTAIARYADWSEITGLVTDSKLDKKDKALLSKEVNLIIAEK